MRNVLASEGGRAYIAGVLLHRQVKEVGAPRFRRRCLRSEEHTSELQSLMRISYAVFCLKKKKKRHQRKTTKQQILSKIQKQQESITRTPRRTKATQTTIDNN